PLQGHDLSSSTGYSLNGSPRQGSSTTSARSVRDSGSVRDSLIKEEGNRGVPGRYYFVHPLVSELGAKASATSDAAIVSSNKNSAYKYARRWDNNGANVLVG
ncbi:unnamed protein product, partial [Amoebophrya sp. A25]